MSAIEWTDRVWNPVRGCSLVSAGCANCYAMKQAHRFSSFGQPYEYLTEIGPQGPRWTGQVRLVPEVLDLPLRWRKPRRIFVNSMSDLFHPDVPAPFIVRVFEIIAACPQHEFQILTKRPERIESVLYGSEGDFYLGGGDWLPNVWIGFSAEDQVTYDQRLAAFAARPGERCAWSYALKLFVSCEPLLGPIQLFRRVDCQPRWIICGGESGPHARPCDVGWIRSIVEQCRAAGVPCFVKQLGANIIDRNDAGFDAEYETWTEGPDAGKPVRPDAWPTPRDIEDDIHGFREEYQGADVRIRLWDRKGGDMKEWPEALRVREWPR